MIRFGHFYLGDRFVLYDLQVALVDGQWRWVAALSENPEIRFVEAHADDAAAALRRYFEQLAAFNAQQAA